MATDREAQTQPGFLGFASLPLVLVVAAMVVGIAALLPLVQSSGAATTAGNITSLTQQRDDWQTRLEEQQLKIASLSSLAAVRKSATERLHMVEPTDVRFITVDAPAPAADTIPDRLLPVAKEPPKTGTSLLDDIIGLLP